MENSTDFRWNHRRLLGLLCPDQKRAFEECERSLYQLIEEKGDMALLALTCVVWDVADEWIREKDTEP